MREHEGQSGRPFSALLIVRGARARGIGLAAATSHPLTSKTAPCYVAPHFTTANFS